MFCVLYLTIYSFLLTNCLDCAVYQSFTDLFPSICCKRRSSVALVQRGIQESFGLVDWSHFRKDNPEGVLELRNILDNITGPSGQMKVQGDNLVGDNGGISFPIENVLNAALKIKKLEEVKSIIDLSANSNIQAEHIMVRIENVEKTSSIAPESDFFLIKDRTMPNPIVAEAAPLLDDACNKYMIVAEQKPLFLHLQEIAETVKRLKTIDKDKKKFDLMKQNLDYIQNLETDRLSVLSLDIFEGLCQYVKRDEDPEEDARLEGILNQKNTEKNLDYLLGKIAQKETSLKEKCHVCTEALIKLAGLDSLEIGGNELFDLNNFKIEFSKRTIRCCEKLLKLEVLPDADGFPTCYLPESVYQDLTIILRSQYFENVPVHPMPVSSWFIKMMDMWHGAVGINQEIGFTVRGCSDRYVPKSLLSTMFSRCSDSDICAYFNVQNMIYREYARFTPEMNKLIARGILCANTKKMISVPDFLIDLLQEDQIEYNKNRRSRYLSREKILYFILGMPWEKRVYIETIMGMINEGYVRPFAEIFRNVFTIYTLYQDLKKINQQIRAESDTVAVGFLEQMKERMLRNLQLKILDKDPFEFLRMIIEDCLDEISTMEEGQSIVEEIKDFLDIYQKRTGSESSLDEL